jgi:Tol biopolymer transport system component
MLFTSLKKLAWLSLPIISLSLLMSSCGGSNSMPNTPVTPAVLTVAFGSSGALDGSSSANSNSTGNIWLAKTDGSAAMPLTRLSIGGSNSSEPVWSPDGKKIAFVSTRALDGSDAIAAASNIWVINADGTAVAPLTRLTTSGVLFWQLAWSPDGRKLAFASSAALDGSDALSTNGTINVWVMNADGTGTTPLTRLTVNPAGGAWTSQEVTWSPDSTKIAFLSVGALDGTNALNTNGVFNLWIVKADGTSLSPLTRLTAIGVFQSYPAWSPDGAKIAFVAQRALDASDAASPTNAMNLWTINADGSGATPLSRFTSNDFMFYPVWSPDGSKLAFGSSRALDGSDASNINSAANVWTINANGTGAFAVTRLTATGINFALPMTWSPGGKKIGFTSQRALDGTDAANPSGATNVWLLNADGSSAIPVTKLTSGTASSGLPVWKP